MILIRQTVWVVGITVSLLFVQSCSLGIFTAGPRFDVSDVTLEERLNGYLIRIVANRPIDDFEVLVNRDYRLNITIAEASVDLESLRSLRPTGLVEEIEVTPSEHFVQLMMKFSRKIRYRDVIRLRNSNDILLAIHLD